MPILFDENKFPYIDMGNGHRLRLEYEEPSDETKERAVRELRETPENVAKSIAELKELLKNETNLYLPVEDQYLLIFLRPCHFYPNSAFEKVRKIFRFKIKHSSMFEDITPGQYRPICEQNIINLMPVRSKTGGRVLWITLKKWKPSVSSLDQLFSALQLIVMASVIEPTTQICGGSVVLDMEGLPLGHVMHFTPSFAATLLEWLQEIISIRVKSIHVINQSYVFNMLYAIFKPFIREKLRKRIHFHNKEYKAMIDMLGADCMPKKIGGNLDCNELNGSEFADLLQWYSKEFEMRANYGYIDDKKTKNKNKS